MSEAGEEVLFSTRVRKATRKIHNISDALVNAKFAISLRDEEVWAGGLFVFYHVFAFLEDARERLKMESFDGLFIHKCMYRKSAFEEDLSHYLGEEWRCKPKPQPLENYIEHLQELERSNPELLMAYVYHLYLGLLSGGQILAKKRKRFGDENTSPKYVDRVLDFTGMDIAKLKNDFRQSMNEISSNWSEEQKQAFIDESSLVFIMNNMIVNSVGGQNRVVYMLLLKASVVIALITSVIVAYKSINK